MPQSTEHLKKKKEQLCSELLNKEEAQEEEEEKSNWTFAITAAFFPLLQYSWLLFFNFSGVWETYNRCMHERGVSAPALR